MITASHNPPEWNGLKFVSRAGAFLTDAELKEVKRIIRQGSYRRAELGWSGSGARPG